MAVQVASNNNFTLTADGVEVGYIMDSVEQTETATDIDVTALGDRVQSFRRGEIDPGSLSFTVALDEQDAGNAKLVALQTSGEVVTFALSFPNGDSVSQSGYVKSLGRTIPRNDKLTRSVEVKLTGEATVTAGGGA
jgi:hypothetical protein